MYRGHATELTSHAAEEGYDTVICCGGDGTLNETISGILTIPADDRPALGYVPCGSTNDFAVSMGLSASFREAARVAMGDHEMRIDTGCFSASNGCENAPRFFSYIASFGVFTAASYSTPQAYKNVFGHAAYILQGIKDLGNIQPRHARVELPDGTVAEGDYIFGAITNTTSVAGLVRLPTEQYSMSDGEFEVFLVHNPRTVAELNKIITALMTSDLKENPLIDFYHASSVRITLDEPIAWSLDGEEALGGPNISVTCLPKSIRIKTDML
jgi:YegS/Rv2252/BmrU family lipid kinase